MIKSNKISLLISLAILTLVVIGCESGPVSMGDLTTSKDKEGKEATSTFKAGDKINARTTISNNTEKVKVKFYLSANEDLAGLKKDEALEGSEVSLDLEDKNIATYFLETPKNMPAGKYKLTAELIDAKGDKKDSKTADVTIEGGGESEDNVNYSPPVGNGGG
jgi:hypothetical protein